MSKDFDFQEYDLKVMVFILLENNNTELKKNKNYTS
jgi:hypothetical protein